MENSLNATNVDNKPNKVVKKKSKSTKNSNAILNNEQQAIVDKKPNDIMARRYQLAYSKLYDALPSWKKHSFINVTRSDDTLYNEFISSVIALAEDEKQDIFLTA